MAATRWVAPALAAMCLPALPLVGDAQTPDDALTVERIYGSDYFDGDSISLRWMPDGRHWTTVEQDMEGRDELWRVDAQSGSRQKLISAVELVPEAGQDPIAIEGHQLSEDGRRVLIFTNSQQVWRQRTKGEYYVFEFDSRRLSPVSAGTGWQMFAKLSPDGHRAAFVRDHDLYLVDLTTGAERQLTFDGSETVVNGTSDWVYEEELRLRDAFRWSTDGERIAYWRFDQSPVRPYPLVDHSPLYPELKQIRYPKAGEANSRVQVGSLELSTGRTTWFDIGPEEDIYIARMEWAESPHEVVIQRLNRWQNRLDLLLGDAHTGETTLLFSEEDDAWVDANDDLRWIDGGSRFTWTSERDGYRHVYLYHRSGRLVRQLTRGPWDVIAFHGADQVSGRIFFTAASETPLTRTVHSVSLEGTDMLTLAGGRGSHSADFSPDFELFGNTHSTIGSPPTTALRRAADGSLVRILVNNAELASRIDALGLREPEFFTIGAADGIPLNGWIIKPRDFDPRRAYPLLLGDARGEHRQPGDRGERPRLQEAGLHAAGDAGACRPAGSHPPAHRAVVRRRVTNRRVGMELRRLLDAHDLSPGGGRRIGRGGGGAGNVVGAVRHDLHRAFHEDTGREPGGIPARCPPRLCRPPRSGPADHPWNGGR
jgi:dipeptidyl-peptidase-4